LPRLCHSYHFPFSHYSFILWTLNSEQRFSTFQEEEEEEEEEKEEKMNSLGTLNTFL